jgi:hypothetical protein
LGARRETDRRVPIPDRDPEINVAFASVEIGGKIDNRERLTTMKFENAPQATKRMNNTWTKQARW